MKFLQNKIEHGGQDDRVKAISVFFEAPIYSLPEPEVSCHESMSTTTIMDVNNTFVESPFDSYGVPPRGTGRPSSYSESTRVSPDLRQDHFVELVPN
ncbi:hypothetical protein ILUMI_14120 [Ignelater luminosus]|uniref:Uncharacterized protein n=1 Tax=Ignelater luminosus TaxID=2038154 RepID=A0A8K0CWI6_IGNLU|nr:hypothetical protein ILUMI_14120 [Ignelater luminosus]